MGRWLCYRQYNIWLVPPPHFICNGGRAMLRCAALLCAANTHVHIAAALGVGNISIFKVKKLVESGQDLAIPMRCVRMHSMH